MLKLYGGARSRASIVQWYLEELQVPYEFVMLDMQAGEHLNPEFLAINPMGKVPAIVDDTVTLWESGAILLYLAQKYDPIYPKTLEAQAQFAQWVLFANSTLSTGIFFETEREREAPKLLGALSDRFLKHPFVTGKSFTVADVAVGSVLGYIAMLLQFDYSPYPGVVTYLKQISERSAYRKAIMGL